ncbi:MAG: ABC transporter permease [Myxococcota bacterium]
MKQLVLALLAAFLAVFALLPLALLLPRAGAFGVAAGEWEAAANTLVLCGGTVALALAVGLPLGVALARVRLPAWLARAVVLPYAVPPYVTTIAWIQLANPSNGLLTRWLPLDVYSLPGMVWVLGLHLSPFVSLAVRDALGRLDPALEEAARVAGASRARVLRDVTLPMVAPAVLAAAGFVVSASAASFGVPYLLTAPAKDPTPVLTTRIYQALELSPATGRPLAVTLALGLCVLGLALPAALRALEGRRSYAGAKPGRVVASASSPVATAGVVAFVAIAVVLPLATIVATSFSARFGSFETLTLASWEAVLGADRTRDALFRSLWLAAAAATVAVGAGALVAHAAERDATRPARALAAVARAPWAIPGTVLALGMLLAFSQEVRLVVAERVTFVLALADTAWLLGIAYVVKFFALPVDGTRAALRALHPSMEEAARISGAGWGRTLHDVTLPLLAPALGTAWFLVFVPSFCEVTLSVLLRGPRTEVLGTLLFYLQGYADPQAAAVLAVVVVAVLLAGMGLSWSTSKA